MTVEIDSGAGDDKTGREAAAGDNRGPAWRRSAGQLISAADRQTP